MSTLTWITEKELEREIQNKGDGFRSRGSTLSPQVRSPFAGAHLGTKGESTKGKRTLLLDDICSSFQSFVAIALEPKT